MKTNADYWADWENHVFGLGYGTGEHYVIPLLKRFLDAVPVDGTYDYRVLEKTLGAEQTWLLINALVHANIIEYGSSPRFGWLTPQGKTLREFVSQNSAHKLIEFTNKDCDYINCFPDHCNCDDPCKNPFWSNR